MKKLFDALEKQIIGDGDLIGQPFKLLPYQKKFLRGVFKPGIIQGALSLGRGGGKTGLLSTLAADSVKEDGFLHRPGGETILVAASFAQAAIGGDPIRTILGCEKGGEHYDLYRCVRQQNQLIIQNRESKARLRAIGSNHESAHGLRPNLVLCDEPAQWGASGERLTAALATSLGKRKGAKLLFFGTRPRNSLHFYARLLNDPDPSVFCISYSAKESDPWHIQKTWHKANPGMRYGLPLKETLIAESRRAKTDPSLLASFKALRLNLGTDESDDRDLLIDPETWQELLEQEAPAPEGRPCFGVDLGGSAAMSAISACWPNGRLETICMFGREPSLDQRALQDGVGSLYETAKTRGELLVSSKRIPDLQELFGEALQRFGVPSVIACDTWRLAELRDELEGSEIMNALSSAELVTRRHGFGDGDKAIRAWKRAVTGKMLYPAGKPLLLTAALAEAVVRCDQSGNECLSKGTEGGRRKRLRDDCVSASLLAVEQAFADREPEYKYGGTF